MAKQYFSSINTVILLKVVNKFFNKRNVYLNLSIVTLKPAACWVTLGELFTPVWWNWQSRGDRKVTVQINVSIKTSRTYPWIPWIYLSYCDGFKVRRSWSSFGWNLLLSNIFLLKTAERLTPQSSNENDYYLKQELSHQLSRNKTTLVRKIHLGIASTVCL